MKRIFFTAHGSRLTAHGSRLTAILCLIVNIAFGQSPAFSCGTNADSADYQAAMDFLSSGIHVAGNWNSEVSVPLHIIYVNEDDGTPPGQIVRISESVNVANQIFDSIANIYVCGYHHINNSNFSNLNWLTEREPLYDFYHLDGVINVYIVSNLDVGGGVAPLPNHPKNNMMILASGTIMYTLAHELGHNFGLFHTHQGNTYISSTGFCSLVDPNANPLTTGDLVEDTPVDPSPFLLYTDTVCLNPIGCPKAISSCTPSCTTHDGQSYTYTDYWTNNIMSYYKICSPQVLTDDQVERVNDHLANHAGLAFLRDGIEPTCNNDISEVGYINKYCQYSTPNPGVTPVKGILLDMRNETTDWEGGRKKTDLNGEYNFYQNDYSNLSTVSIELLTSHPHVNLILVDSASVPQNYWPKNGCDIPDMILTGKHILHGNVLSLPYGYIAADVNTNGAITTFDIVNMRKVFLGLVPDFPSGTWHYVPEYYFNNIAFETAFEDMPFTATYGGLAYPLYMDELVLHMDDASVADPNNWSFHAIKMGDVDCSMNLDTMDGFTSGGEEESMITVGLGGSVCVQNNDVITIEVQGSASQSLLGYQLGMQYDQNKLHYIGSSTGNLVDYNPENFAEHNGEIRTLWNRNDFEPEAFTTQKTLFNLHFKVLEGFCNLSGVFNLADEVVPSRFYDNNIEPIPGNIILNYHEETAQGNLLSIYPNPATNAVVFSIQLNQPNLVEIRLSDYLGHVLTTTQAYNTGTFSYTFPNLSSLSNGPLNYTVKIGSVTHSGILLKSQP